MATLKLYVFIHLCFPQLTPMPDAFQANILVSREGIAKLSDFDHSIMAECSLACSETSKQGGGTIRWMVSAVESYVSV